MRKRHNEGNFFHTLSRRTWQTRLRLKGLPPKTLGSELGGSRRWKTENLGKKISVAFSFTLGQDIGNNVRETSVKAGIRTWDNKQC